MLLCLLTAGCGPTRPPEVVDESIHQQDADNLINEPSEQIAPRPVQHGETQDVPDVYAGLLAHFNEWQGVPYRLGGLSKKGIDCSGFTQLTFARLFDLSLPRTTDAQVNTGQEIPRKQLMTGDLVFFKTGWQRQKHVGIYLQDQVFLHASTSRGVMLSRMDNPYWQKNFWKAVRPFTELQLAAQAVPNQNIPPENQLSGEL